jgi:spermidine synthase
MTQWFRAVRRSAFGRYVALFGVGAVLLAIGYAAADSRVRVLYEAESPFGRIQVSERADGLRLLRTGERAVLQTALHPGRPKHLESPYVRVAMIGLALVPADSRILFVGLGGGVMPTYTRHVLPDARIDVVEIDPAIVDVARRFFGFTPDAQMAVRTADGRAFLARAPPASWDLIVLDAFSADEVPFALTTREFLETVRSRLRPGGVVVSNLWSAGAAYAPMLATYDAVFEQVHLVRVPRRAQRILVAGAAEVRLDRDALVGASRALAARADLGFQLAPLVRRGYEPLPRITAPVLRDGPR